MEEIMLYEFPKIQHIFIVEITSLLKLDHHGKPGSTGRLFRPIVRLISSAHPRSRLARFDPRTIEKTFYGSLVVIRRKCPN